MSNGNVTKARSAGLECPVFEDATVAVLTPTPLHHPDQPGFEVVDTSCRVLDGSRRDPILGHWSQHVDEIGFGLDDNVVYPIDGLQEMADSGRIGNVSAIHLADAGNQFEADAR